MNHVTTGGRLKTNPHNLKTSHRNTNDSRIRRFERFLEKNKLDNALVVTGSGNKHSHQSQLFLTKALRSIARGANPAQCRDRTDRS